MGRPRKKIEAVEGPSGEGRAFPPNQTTTLVAPVEVEPACRDCHFGVDYLPRVPNGTLILRCQRFPPPVEVFPDYWCGEYRRSEAP